ncbi:MAG TPA: glycine--tRNA ligase subunit beta [Spirochaetota bacterium]|nr:glycine--tRNA ligase subunit beta [Spirochaetota bacterium]HNT12342.1 glycine--tRNA ligase subunit beta [Spirochaetota bacterium]
MIQNANFLCEIGCEEVPAGYVPPACAAIRALFEKRLADARIAYTELGVYATPRRFAVLASGMAERQAEEEVEVKGPSVKAAYDASRAPTKALEGFLKGNALALADVFPKATEKGEYLFARKTVAAVDTAAVLPAIVNDLVATVPFPKRMRWSDKAVTFPRPVRYVLLMLNDRVVPFEISGIAAGKSTRGHYVQHNRMVDLSSIAAYETTLEEHGVIVDQERRRAMIADELAAAAKRLHGVLVEDEDLLDTVTYLVERPYVVDCRFRDDFLAIPDIVLITEMKEHQKYFAVRDAKGALSPTFLVVSNNPPNDNIRAGNVRVISARFNDARFFFDEDRKTTLADKVESLKTVLFHKELGTIYEKVMRVDRIAARIADMTGLDAATKALIARAVLLAKADLNTAMVFEFTSLQGQIGKIYAELDGEDPAVARAIDDQYRPRFQGDELPSAPVSVVLSLAEKFDNIFGSFSVGNIPGGSSDPYALRRQAGAIIDLVVKNGMRLDVKGLLEGVSGQYAGGAGLIDKLLAFITARAKTFFEESGFRYDEIDACLSIGRYDYAELYERARRLNEFRADGQFSQMLMSFKRMNNILASFRRDNPTHALAFSEANLREDSEKRLHEFFSSRKGEIEGCVARNDCRALFRLLIEGKATVDAFFDGVMVMADDPAVRDNRLALLEGILTPYRNFLDFSKIAE